MRLNKTLTRLIAATTAACILIAPLAHADREHRGKGKWKYERGYERGYDRGYDRGYERRHKRSHKYHYRHSYKPHYSYSPPRAYYAPPRSSVTVTYGYTYGPHHYRGYAPRYNVGSYYSYAPRTVYISEYDRYGLYAPPRGYHWVRDHDNGDAVLASVATGAIIGLVVGALVAD
jgi:Ni/Co efflux regulator RcnB